MSLLDEYGESKYNSGKVDGIEQVIVNILKSGDDANLISQKTGISLKRILAIKEKNKL